MNKLLLCFFLTISVCFTEVSLYGNVSSNAGGMKNTVIWIYFKNYRVPKEPKVKKMVQRGKEFFPKILVAPVNTQVWFPNEDDIFHNIYSYNKVKKLDLGKYKGDGKPVEFTKRGIYPIGCEIHPWMGAYVVVLDTDFFAKGDIDGNFFLDKLKEGETILNIWGPRLKKRVKRKLLLKNGVNSIDIFIEPDEMKKSKKKRKRRKNVHRVKKPSYQYDEDEDEMDDSDSDSDTPRNSRYY
ncbi:MAG: hypothetical protein KC646_13340 [Candidatus Cloacimonetes bacterium]|nr:hypothetical protein [Candidatus Cloacimonadota bacterium]